MTCKIERETSIRDRETRQSENIEHDLASNSKKGADQQKNELEKIFGES